MNRFFKLNLLGVVGLALVAGCSSKSDDSADDGSYATAEQQLDEDNGGFTTDREVQGFGDPEVQSLVVMSNAFADTTDMTADAASAPGATRYHVALIWGHLPPAADATTDDSAPTAASWVGSVSVDAGEIGLKRTLQFDALDKVDPRTDPKTLSFTSHTLPFVDGLYLDVVIPSGGTPTLHYATASLTTDIDLSQLATQGGGVDRLPDNANGMFWVGYQDSPACAKGLVFGRWVKDRAALGRFRGVVIDSQGQGLGYLKGIWGHAPKHDANVFFGKYIDTTGAFKGLLGGTFDSGRFSGDWGTVDPNDTGKVEGIYSDGYDKDDGRGVWIGRWSEKCN